MAMYEDCNSSREVKCKECGEMYTETLYEYIGGPKYWSGRCKCQPVSYDAIVKGLEGLIIALDGTVIQSNWDYKLIHGINNKISKRCAKLGKYYRIKALTSDDVEYYWYNAKYPSKKAIADSLGLQVKEFYKEVKGLSNIEVFIKYILDITVDDYCHYLSYMCYLRTVNY